MKKRVGALSHLLFLFYEKLEGLTSAECILAATVRTAAVAACVGLAGWAWRRLAAVHCSRLLFYQLLFRLFNSGFSYYRFVKGK